MRSRPALLALLALCLVSACSSATSVPLGAPDASTSVDGAENRSDASAIDASAIDAGTPDTGPFDGGNKAEHCASTFGSTLTASFGRMDGTLLAVVGPSDTQCAVPNADHLVPQIMIGGAVYRVVVNVLSDGRNMTDTKLRYQERHHALVGGPFSEGWHPSVTLDYPTDLGLHSDASWTPTPMAELVQKVTDRLVLGAKISAYATSSGGMRADSAHLVHRNGGGHDGALVIDPDSADPLYLVFYFDGTTF